MHATYGVQPPFDPSTALIAIDRAKREVTDAMNTRLLPEIERLDGILSAERTRTARLSADGWPGGPDRG